MRIKYDTIGLIGLIALFDIAILEYDQFVTVRHQIPKDLNYEITLNNQISILRLHLK